MNGMLVRVCLLTLAVTCAAMLSACASGDASTTNGLIGPGGSIEITKEGAGFGFRLDGTTLAIWRQEVGEAERAQLRLENAMDEAGESLRWTSSSWGLADLTFLTDAGEVHVHPGGIIRTEDREWQLDASFGEQTYDLTATDD